MIRQSPFFSHLILLITLAALLAVLLFSKNVYLKSQNLSEQNLFPGFSPDRVVKIEIGRNGEQTVLEKKEERWLVFSNHSAPAAKAPIKEILDTIAATKKGDFVSENPKTRDAFQLGEGALRAVFLDSGSKALADFYLGKTGPDWLSTYLRKEGENKIYLVKGNLKSLLDQADFRDLSIFSFNKSQVEKLTVKSGGEEIVLEKKKDGEKELWRLEEPKEAKAKEEVVDAVVSELSQLTAKDLVFEAESGETGLEKPTLSLSVQLSGGEEKAIVIGRKTDKGDYYAKATESDQVYLLPAFVYATLDKREKDFRAKGE